ncbi:MAG: hypothetical protein DRI57_14560 [Deltaproteobacteria bacterium]|nr:MAG: hypothetical protein DRI57_14560 [Deltaproteobacteria bacterium]
MPKIRKHFSRKFHPVFEKFSLEAVIKNTRHSGRCQDIWTPFADNWRPSRCQAVWTPLLTTADFTEKTRAFGLLSGNAKNLQKFFSENFILFLKNSVWEP